MESSKAQKADHQTNKQICSKSKSKVPPTRHLHSLVTYNGDLFLFGGLGRRNEVLNDLWQFSTDSEMWTRQIKLKGPPPRHSHQAVVIKGKMFVFGGISNKKTSNELWSFDFEERTWELEKKFSIHRSGHSMVALGNSIVIFGGANESNYLSNDFYIINSNTFAMITMDHNDCISPRKYASMAVADGYIYLYGGLGTDSLGGLYKIDLKLPSKKVDIEAIGSSAFRVHGATLTTSPYKYTHLVLLGGLSNSELNGRTFSYSTTSAGWLELAEFREYPPKRYFHQTCTIDGTMYVFGGLDEDGKEVMKDMLIFGNRYSKSSPHILSNEIWLMILRQMNGEELVMTSMTSRTLLQLVKSDKKTYQTLQSYKRVIPPIRDQKIEIVAIGDVDVSSSIIQFSDAKLDESGVPSLVASHHGTFILNDETYHLGVRELVDIIYVEDNARLVSINAIAQLHLIDTVHGAYAVYDITRPETVLKLDTVLKHMIRTKKSNFPIIIVGNTADQAAERKVSQKEGQDLARQYRALWMEANTQNTEDIKGALNSLFRLILDVYQKQRGVYVTPIKEENEVLANPTNTKNRCSVM